MFGAADKGEGKSLVLILIAEKTENRSSSLDERIPLWYNEALKVNIGGIRFFMTNNSKNRFYKIINYGCQMIAGYTIS